jgi:N utilization substance protein B
MLNRRTLRVKAMQNLYALFQSQRSNFNLALDRIADDFMPDLNSMEPQKPIQLAAYREQAQTLFKQQYKSGKIQPEREAPVKVLQSAVAALNFYRQQNDKDFQAQSRTMLRQADGIYDQFLLMLQLAVEFGHLAQVDAEERARKRGDQTPQSAHLYHNPLVVALRNHPELKESLLRRGLLWDVETVRGFFRLLGKDPAYVAYRQSLKPTAEEEADMAAHLFRDFMFAHENLVEYFENQHLAWDEDKSVLRDMVNKVIKHLPDNPTQPLPLLSLSWEDDRQFYQDLFTQAVAEADYCEQLLAARTQNWDIDRITMIDRILLNLAMTEMMHFPSIPVKVSINEYIELSKEYSTPRSYNFVNGLLNTLNEDLAKEGKIRKSGRGLIDNK